MTARSVRRATAIALAVWLGLVLAPGAAATDEAAQPRRTVTISASGDILVHNTLYTRARTKTGYDFRPLLRGLRPVLAADVNICQLETPLTSGEPSNYPRFATPVQIADAIKFVGFDGCSFASNHAIDRGIPGVFDTLRALRTRGLQSAGTRLRPSESGMAWYKLADGLKVAQLSYTYGLNGLWLPSDKQWLVNQINVPRILSDAHSARLRGASLVIVTLHWGNEYQSDPTNLQRRVAKLLTASSDIDAIVGHHTHVLQPAELINGKPVVFGLGNLWSGQIPAKGMPRGQHGAVVTLTFDIDEAGAHYSDGSYVPTLTLANSWLLQPAESVTLRSQVTEACRSIQDAAEHLGKLLSGPNACPIRY